MESIKYELKYCEGCGTLKLRPVLAGTPHCRVCDNMLTRFRFPRKVLAHLRAGLPHPAGLPTAGALLRRSGGAVDAGRSQ